MWTAKLKKVASSLLFWEGLSIVRPEKIDSDLNLEYSPDGFVFRFVVAPKQSLTTSFELTHLMRNLIRDEKLNPPTDWWPFLEDATHLYFGWMRFEEVVGRVEGKGIVGRVIVACYPDEYLAGEVCGQNESWHDSDERHPFTDRVPKAELLKYIDKPRPRGKHDQVKSASIKRAGRLRSRRSSK